MKNYQELKEWMQVEKKVYFGSQPVGFNYKLRKTTKYEIYRYIMLLRKYEYFCYKRDHSKNMLGSKYWIMRVKLCDRNKNIQGIKLGIEITPGYTEKGIRICHQNVIINGYIGEGCIFHGNNVIGNKKTGSVNAIPRIGANVDVGAGAIIIGDVTIADNCIIGAGAVVTQSFLTPGTIIAGVPAKAIESKKD